MCRVLSKEGTRFFVASVLPEKNNYICRKKEDEKFCKRQ